MCARGPAVPPCHGRGGSRSIGHASGVSVRSGSLCRPGSRCSVSVRSGSIACHPSVRSCRGRSGRKYRTGSIRSAAKQCEHIITSASAHGCGVNEGAVQHCKQRIRSLTKRKIKRIAGRRSNSVCCRGGSCGYPEPGPVIVPHPPLIHPGAPIHPPVVCPEPGIIGHPHIPHPLPGVCHPLSPGPCIGGGCGYEQPNSGRPVNLGGPHMVGHPKPRPNRFIHGCK